MKRNLKMYKKAILAVFMLAATAVTVYFVYFRHPPASDIMAANKRKTSQRNIRLASEIDYQNLDPLTESTMMWDDWIEDNSFVSIGELYTKCEGDDRVMVGKTVMLQDKKLGGVFSKTYVNITWPYEIDDGELFIEVKYNGKDLYSNHWELCTVEDGEPDRIVYCPVKKGYFEYIKNIKIPNFIPKGRYVTKVWVLDQDKKEIGCAYSDFVL